MAIENILDHIAIQLETALPFVAYRKADEEQLNVVLQQDATLYTTTAYNISGFVFAPFDDTRQQTIVIPLAKSNVYNISIKGLKEDLETLHTVPKTTYATTTQEQHINKVSKAITAIQTTPCEKIVISRKESIPTTGVETITLLKRLLNTYPKALVYCWYHPKVGLWLGATPETLLTITKNHFFTMALAGTQPNTVTRGEDVVWGQKERTEQRMVSDYIVEGLSPITETINRSKTYTHKAGTVAHLRTDISGILPKNVDINTIITQLHPTPAVCGVPQQLAKSFIIENEEYDRKFYTGFLGMIQKDEYGSIDAHLFVNLRCMEIIDHTAILYIGGGITADSNPEKEWEETVKKSETMKHVLYSS